MIYIHAHRATHISTTQCTVSLRRRRPEYRRASWARVVSSYPRRIDSPAPRQQKCADAMYIINASSTSLYNSRVAGYTAGISELFFSERQKRGRECAGDGENSGCAGLMGIHEKKCQVGLVYARAALRTQMRVWGSEGVRLKSRYSREAAAWRGLGIFMILIGWCLCRW